MDPEEDLAVTPREAVGLLVARLVGSGRLRLALLVVEGLAVDRQVRRLRRLRRGDPRRSQQLQAERIPGRCVHRRFSNVAAARAAHSAAGFRVRAYYCKRCHAFHVANADKQPKRSGRKGR